MQPERLLGFYKKEKKRKSSYLSCFFSFWRTKAKNPRVWDRVPRFCWKLAMQFNSRMSLQKSVGNNTISLIEKYDEVINWWYSLGEEDSTEKNLVIGWIVRNKKAIDPENKSFRERFEIAKSGGWKIPDWMFLDCGSK